MYFFILVWFFFFCIVLSCNILHCFYYARKKDVDVSKYICIRYIASIILENNDNGIYH